MSKIPVILRSASILILVHGILFFVVRYVLEPQLNEQASEALGPIVFFVVLMPAAFLAKPFLPLFWKFGLMVTPGWFAWPKPIAFVIAYSTWVIGLYVISAIARRSLLSAGAKK